MIFFDTETCGLHGMAVLLQYAEDDGPINLYNLWKNPVDETLDLIKKISESEVVGFNLAFDWFHLCKIYTVFSMLGRDMIPEEHIETIALIEPDGRLGPCLKPRAACDLMLFARKGPYQSLMDRKDIKIRRVPTVIAHRLAQELEDRVELDAIYFARRKNKFAPKWNIYDCVRNGAYDPEFKDVVLKFHPSGGLKNLAIHALGEEETLTFDEAGVDKAFRPNECGWAPFAKAVGKPGNWNKAWPEMIQYHIDFWEYNPTGREYAEKDVDYTRRLYYHMNPVMDDNDSVLACMVGAVRWRGFKINVPAIQELRKQAVIDSRKAPRDPARSKAYLLPFMDETEKLALQDRNGNLSTKKVILESIAKWLDDDDKLHPAAIAARAIIDARKAKKKVELYDKLLQAGRFHASFVVIGALSSRMSGSDGLNPQGIDHSYEVRSCFPLADDDMVLNSGDFDSFEVVLADAAYDDPKLRSDLKSGKKIHALMACKMFPDKTYDEIMESKGSKVKDYYTAGKQGVFALVYGGDESTLANKLGVDIETGRKIFADFQNEYKGIRAERQRIYDAFCSMRQPGGIGTKVIWKDPQDYVESLLGYRRYFTLENRVCKALFDLANKPPKEWKDLKVKVTRRDREQTALGAVQSALYGAAFQLQAANMRAAGNHRIQASGAEITKHVQRKVWDVQPSGVHEWVVVPMNVHDEVNAPTKPEYVEPVKEAVLNAVESYRPKVPLIRMDWNTGLKTWADK